MGVDKHQPHVLVLPEDDANRQMATGFCLNLDMSVRRRIQVLPVAGGWARVLEHFLSDHVVYMERYANRFMVLLIDFDRNEERLELAKNRIPERLTERVFLLGAWSNPEDLKGAGLGTFEEIGSAMARDCREETDTIWNHELLRCNASEIARLREQVRSILF
jgi:hypothetical protein